jgi:CRISPR-associated exonuclease Cas4
LTVLVTFFIVVGVLLVWCGRHIIKGTGISEGQIIYMDTHGNGPVVKPLFSKRLGLMGKPDYLLYRKGMHIPVEVKSTRMPSKGAYRSHKLQVAAYCHLVEEHYGKPPNYGIIKYADGTYHVDYSRKLEKDLNNVVACMRTDISAENVLRSHKHINRCVACSFQTVCGDDLTL